MYRKRPTDASVPSADSSLRSRLKAGKSPLQAARAPLSSIQQPSSSRPQASKSKGFSFGTENDTPDEDMETSQPTSSHLNRSQRNQQSNIDPITEHEDYVTQRNEINPRAVGKSREFVRTQAATLAPRMNTEGQAVEGYEGGIFGRLKRLGVEVRTSEDEEGTYFHLGELTHVKLMKLIEKKWPDIAVPTIMEELKNELENNPESWLIFLLQSKNINGDQDTIFRALILSEFFQNPIFDLLIQKLNSIATSKRLSNEQLKIGQDIIHQLRFITQVFHPEYLCSSAFKNKLENWNPQLRDEFIKMMPELFTDPSVHTGATKFLKKLFINGSLAEQQSLQAAILGTVKCFEIDGKTTKGDIYDTFCKNLMNLNIENLPLAVETILSLMDKSKSNYLSDFFFHLSKYLDIEKLRREEARTESATSVDKFVSEIFFRITEFMRCNLNKSEKELAAFYLMAKIHRILPPGFKRQRKEAPVSYGSDFEDEEDSDDDDDDEEDVENVNDPDFVPEKGESEDESQREFDLIDVMLLLCFNEASDDSALVLKELRKQISLSYDNILNLKEVFVQAMTFHTFTLAYEGTILKLASDLVQSPNPTLNEFGTIVYKYYFYNPNSDRGTIIKHLSFHLGEVDSETTAALCVLQEIAKERIEILRKKYIPVLNTWVNHLSFLSTDNIRRLLFVLISLNFCPPSLRPTQAQIRQKLAGDKFIKRLHHYLTSNVSREIIWGVIGLVQYVKVLLITKDGDNNDDEIFEILKKLNDVTTEMSGKVRAEFYLQMSDLLKPMKDLGECDALFKFGDGITNYVKAKIYKQKPPKLPAGSSLGIYDSEAFIEASTNFWINLADLVSKDNDDLTGTICGLLPLLQLVKDFASYRESFLEDSDPLKADYWSTFMFILESNVNLNPITNSTDLSNDQHFHRCNVLYVTIEYLRTVLNMFADCRYKNEQVQVWLDKKLNLMMLCQTNIKGSISKLQTYALPRITHINKDDLIVKTKDAKKPKTKSKKKSAANQSMEDGEDSREASSIFRDNDDSNDTTTEIERRLGNFKLPMPDPPKTISSDQLQWYCTPLRLETVTRLLQLKEQKIRLLLFLVETFHVILKHTLPVKGKQVPVGFGLGSGAQLPYATMDFGSKESRWNNVSAAIRPLFDILSKTVHTFQHSSTQAYTVSHDTIDGIANLLKFCVMIFSRIFQSREIAVVCDHQDTDRTGNLQTRRSTVLSVLSNEINVFDSSTRPQGGDMTREIDLTQVSGLDVSFGSFIHGRISDGVHPAEPMDNAAREGNVIDFFLKVAKFVSTLESASAMLALLKTFAPMDEYHTRESASAALNYLSKTWSEDETADNLDEKNALIIATDYINFRPDNQKLTAITWLIWHQLFNLYPNTIRSGLNINVDNFKDPADFVSVYNDSVFPCFEKLPQWHKLLFKQFNDNLIKTSKLPSSKSKKSKNLKVAPPAFTKQFIKEWGNHVDTFYALVLVINHSGFRVQNVLYTLIKEGKRFISFIMSKQSTFGSLLRSNEAMTRYKDDIIRAVKTVQAANKLLYHLQGYVKDKKACSLLRLIPELKAAQEKMARDFYDAAAEGGFNDTIQFDFFKAKKFVEDGAEKKTPKKAAAKKPKGEKPAAKKRPNKASDEPPKKRARKKKDSVEVIDTSVDDSILAFGRNEEESDMES